MKTLFEEHSRRFNWDTHYKGDVGVEIEVEGHRLPPAPPGWKKVADGSLRGPESCEYVLRNPIKIDQVPEYLARVGREYKVADTKIIDSVRTSVHVHVNVQDLNFIELFNFITLYLVMENILVDYCGEHRTGNFFCLRARDADYIVHSLVGVAKSKDIRPLYTDNLRYAAMNLKAVVQRGSLEFRAMRGTEDFNLIEHWARLLVSLRESAKNFEQPRDIIEGFSEAEGPNFVRQVLGELGRPVALLPNIGERVKEGMRYAQDVAFATDWLAYREWIENRFKNNPFEKSVGPEPEQRQGFQVGWGGPGIEEQEPGLRREANVPRFVLGG